MTEQLILEKLESFGKQFSKLDEKVDKIEIAVGLIAVQSERINNVQLQTRTLWQKYDEAFGVNGTFSIIKQFQAGCPRKYIKISLTRLWWALGILATLVVSCLIRLIMTSGGG